MIGACWAIFLHGHDTKELSAQRDEEGSAYTFELCSTATESGA